MMILLVARRRVIIIITTDPDNDKRLTRVKSMRISLDHFIYCIRLYKCKTIFSICGSIFSIIYTVLRNVSKTSLIASVTTVHGLDNLKGL